MNQLNVLKISAIVAFMALAGFSCFWTAESLYIWQPSITIYGAWIVAVVFYLVASICFGKMLKSLDKHEDYYGKLFGRVGALLLSLTGLIFFWIIVSLPTNTHTLLYRASVTPTILADLNRTQGYLQALKDNNVEINKIEQKYKSKSANVHAVLKKMEAEIQTPDLPGIGNRFNTLVLELERALSADLQNPVKLVRVPKPGSNYRQWLTTVEFYQKQAYDQLKVYRAQCDKEISGVKSAMQSKPLENLIHNNEVALSDINRMEGVSNNIIQAALKDLDNSYAYIKKNSEYIEFKPGDKEQYTRDGATVESRAMLSVPGVWRDYLTTDKFKDHGFEWWVLIALLVDVAAFVFFNIAFKSKDNNSI